MTLLYVASQDDKDPVFLVDAEHLPGLIQGHGLMDKYIIIREIPIHLIHWLTRNWKDSQWFDKM